MIGLKGPRLLAGEKDFIVSQNIAGVVLFKRNIVSIPQIHKLCYEIKHLTKPPVLIAVDAEGGAVNRFSHLKQSPFLPSPEEARAFEPDQIVSLAHRFGDFLKSVGVDINFAPCLDWSLKNSPLLKGRLWGKSPEEILNKACLFAQGLSQAGIVPCFKHFPGHGGVMEDSHKELPQDMRDLSALKSQLNIFYRAFKRQPGWIMASHVVFPLIDKKPVVFSSFFLKKCLRASAGFQGLVVSDDIDMGALSSWTPEERFFYAIKAGCNIVIACQNPDTPHKILNLTKKPDKYQMIKKELAFSSQKVLKIRQNLKPLLPFERIREK